MKYRFLLCLFTLFAGLNSFAQSEVEAPDYDQIKKVTLDKNNDNYYPRLMKRFAANDTTLSLEEYRNLYYGYALQEDYNPYRISKYARKVKDFSVQDSISTAVCDSIIKYGLKALDDFPFDIRSMNMLVYGYQCKNNEAEKQIWGVKLRGLIDAIISSGDGETEETPFYVIYPPHEYEIISRFGLLVKSNTMMPPMLDYIEVEKNKFDVKGYYFNIEKILETYKKKFEY